MASPEIVVPVLAIVATVALVTRAGFRRMPRDSGRSAPANDASIARLEERITRLEQSVDVIAVEMERIGEGQRFLTKLLADRPAAADEVRSRVE